MFATQSPAVVCRADSSVDELDRAIVTLAARINAASHDLLVLIRRFDERGGWLRWGFESCASWLHWRCDLSLSAAGEKVRVAHALKVLPGVALAFARGELSYSKVRALTRVATRDNEAELLAFALRTTAAAAFPAAGARASSMPTTSSTGPPAEKPVSRTSCSCARRITGWYTKAASPLRRITGIAGFSGDPTAGRCRSPAIGSPT